MTLRGYVHHSGYLFAYYVPPHCLVRRGGPKDLTVYT